MTAAGKSAPTKLLVCMGLQPGVEPKVYRTPVAVAADIAADRGMHCCSVLRDCGSCDGVGSVGAMHVVADAVRCVRSVAECEQQ
jgi:hypothetical protein